MHNVRGYREIDKMKKKSYIFIKIIKLLIIIALLTIFLAKMTSAKSKDR